MNSKSLQKIMKAAWTIWRQEPIAFADALRKAWASFKKQAASDAPRLWSPRSGFYRVYVGSAYAQISVKVSSRTVVGWVKAVGMSVTDAIMLATRFEELMAAPVATRFEEQIAGLYNIEFRASKL